MDFGKILSSAWKTIWRHKILWLFGILSSCGRGGGGGSGSGRSGGGSVHSTRGGDWNGNVPPAMKEFFFNVEQFLNQIEGWQIAGLIAVFFLILLLIWILFVILSTIGNIGLIQGTVQSEEGAKKLKFGALLKDGKPFFWRVLGLNFLIALAAFLLTITALLPLFFVAAITFVGLFCLVPIICLLAPIAWIIKIIIQQANIALIVEDLGIIESLQCAWNVFRENLVNLIIMGLILGFGGAIIGFIFALPLLAIIFFTGFGAVLGMENANLGGILFAGGLAFLVYLPILIFLSGVLQAYTQSAWTLTYLALTASPSEPVSEEPLEETVVTV